MCGEIVIERLEHRHQLLAPFERACKPVAGWRMGLEYEVFLFHESFERRAHASEIQALLASWCALEGTPILDQDNIIGVSLPEGELSLEPGGQFEFSAPPVASVWDVDRLFRAYQTRLVTLAAAQNLKVLALGSDPKEPLERRFWMPKARYGVMRPYMATRDSLGLEMMSGTCTTQINLDYASEADMVRKFRVAMALQPLATALFASSPLSLGRPNGYQSYRRHIWRHTDKDRCGMLAFVFEPGMGFERYVDYALDVPMYFVRRQGQYINVAGRSFRDFMAGKLPELPGERPLLGDWQDHLTTLFPEVRLKNVLELRGADSSPYPQPCTLAAFWTGLLYDEEALSYCEALVASWDLSDIMALEGRVATQGLKARLGEKTLYDIAKTILPWACQGYERIEKERDSTGGAPPDFLQDLLSILETKETPADKLLRGFHEAPSLAAFLNKIALV